MAVQSFEERYARMLQELRESPVVDLKDEHRGQPSEYAENPDSIFDELAMHSGISLDPKFRAHLFTAQSMGCRWEISSSEPPLRGEIHLLDMYSALASDQPVFFVESEDDEEEELLDELRIIDRAPYGGGGEMAAVRRMPGSSDPELWFYEPGSGIHRLDIGYCEYIDTLLITKGVYGWQYLFTDLSFEDARVGGHVWRIKLMLDVFPDVFPDHDYTALRHRLDERQ
jgi:hypothetical protein